MNISCPPGSLPLVLSRSLAIEVLYCFLSKQSPKYAITSKWHCRKSVHRGKTVQISTVVWSLVHVAPVRRVGVHRDIASVADWSNHSVCYGSYYLSRRKKWTSQYSELEHVYARLYSRGGKEQSGDYHGQTAALQVEKKKISTKKIMLRTLRKLELNQTQANKKMIEALTCLLETKSLSVFQNYLPLLRLMLE